jgi:hypothetical protein
MVNREQVALLKQGAEKWNIWRRQNIGIKLDLSAVILSDANLVNLNGVDLRGAQMVQAQIVQAHLSAANLTDAKLSGADLRGADLSGAELNGADLRGADLRGADLSGAELSGANLRGAKMLSTVFVDVDLRETEGLVEIQHDGPSIVQLHTVQLPQDGSALHFLRGTGVPDEYINTWRTTMMHPIQYHSLFISYSSKDDTLARRLHADLQVSSVAIPFAF